MKTIITWLQGSSIVKARIYDDDGRLVEEKEYNGIKLLEINTPIYIPKTLLDKYRVFIIDGRPSIATRGTILVVSNGCRES